MKTQKYKVILFIKDAGDEIDSSYEQGKVLKLLVSDKTLNDNQIIAVSKASTYINSDYEQSNFYKA